MLFLSVGLVVLMGLLSMFIDSNFKVKEPYVFFLIGLVTGMGAILLMLTGYTLQLK